MEDLSNVLIMAPLLWIAQGFLFYRLSYREEWGDIFATEDL